MLGSNVMKFRSSGCGKQVALIYDKCILPKQPKIPHFSSFHSKILNYNLFKELYVKCQYNAGKYLPYRCDSTQVSFAAKNEIKQEKSHFREIMFARKKQAHRTVLLHTPKKEDLPYALAKCEKFGNIVDAYTYSGESNNWFLLIEFSDEIASQTLLTSCQYKNISDAFPVFSRIIQLKKKPNTSLPNINIIINEATKSTSSLKEGASMSEVIEDVYSTEKLTELDIRLRYFFCALLKESISGLFPHCDVLPFGSSVNGIGKHGCDLDIMIRLYPEQVNGDDELVFLNKTCIGRIQALQQRAVCSLKDYIGHFFPGITRVTDIPRARVPILKMNHNILKMDCDVSFNNMSAIFMTDIIHFCGEIDHRVRPLIYGVKKWAKEAGITSNKPSAQITNFGLTTLLLYFLQNRPNPILPSLNDALVIAGQDYTVDFNLQYLKSVEEWKSQASLNKESLAVLLKEFFLFLATYPFDGNILSLMSGKPRPHNEDYKLCVQYPLEEDLNITKNVSRFHFFELCEKARITAEHLENNLNKKVKFSDDYLALLGISRKSDSKLNRVMNVNSFYDDYNSKRKATKHRTS